MTGDKTFNETSPVSATPGAQRRVALIVYHLHGAQLVPLAPNQPVVVGREPPAHVVVSDKSLSRQHARFALVGDYVMVEDLGSTNGTVFRGQRVTRDLIPPGEIAVLGKVSVAVHWIAGSEPNNAVAAGHDWFRIVLDDEVLRARHFSRALSVAVVRAPDREAHLAAWCPRVAAVLRPVDRLAVYGPQAVEVLLPETGLDDAIAFARRVVGERGPGDPQLVCGFAVFPEDAASGEELVSVSCAAALAATAAEPVHHATRSDVEALSAVGRDGRGAIVRNARMRELYETAERLARSAIPVLLQGETGSGKEVLARAIHDGGPRRDKPVICVNCGAIPSQLVESTLFGHERGAFTGAANQHRGVFEAAEGGTVLLDEVGELPPPAQAALLRVLESKKVVRVGGTREIDVDARVVAATHRDLEAMCAREAFRTDLYYRLNAVTLHVPPLRDRPEEIEVLIEVFLQQANAANGGAIRGIHRDAMALLTQYTWPGNIRELKNAIERAVVIARETVITVIDLPERVRNQPQPTASQDAAMGSKPLPTAPGEEAPDPAGTTSEVEDFKARMQRYETELIVDALRRADGSQVAAAQLLNIPLRTLKHKLKALGIRKGFGAP